MVRSYLTLRDFVEIEKYLDRARICEHTGINYQTLSGKINRFKKGKNSSLSIQQSEKLIEYLLDTHNVLTMSLKEPD